MKIFGKKLKLPKIGMRSIKTVIATLIAIVASRLLGFTSPFYPTMTAFLSIQGSIIETSEVSVKRIVGTMIGGGLSLIYLLTLPENVYVIPLGILIIIYLCNILEKSDLIVIASVVFLTISFRISSGESSDTFSFVIIRLIETFVGIVIAMLVNYYIKPPNPFDKLITLNEEMIEFIRNIINEDGTFNKVRNLEQYSLRMDEFRNLIQFYHKEVNTKKYKVDIKYYMKHLTLFRSAYSYIYILDSTKDEMSMDIKKYHISNLINIKEELLK